MKCLRVAGPTSDDNFLARSVMGRTTFVRGNVSHMKRKAFIIDSVSIIFSTLNAKVHIGSDAHRYMLMVVKYNIMLKSLRNYM